MRSEARLRAATIALTIVAAPAVMSAETSKVVAIQNFAFEPATVTVSVGERISFVNRDELPHSVVGLREGKEIFRSGWQMDQDEAFSVVMERPGEIVIQCGLHARMTARIVVEP